MDAAKTLFLLFGGKRNKVSHSLARHRSPHGSCHRPGDPALPCPASRQLQKAALVSRAWLRAPARQSAATASCASISNTRIWSAVGFAAVRVPARAAAAHWPLCPAFHDLIWQQQRERVRAGEGATVRHLRLVLSVRHVLHRAHTSGFCSALEQLSHSVALLLSLSAVRASHRHGRQWPADGRS